MATRPSSLHAALHKKLADSFELCASSWVVAKHQTPFHGVLLYSAMPGIACCGQVLDMRERALGGEHPEVAASLNNLAVLLRAVDKASSGLHLHARFAFY